MTTSAWWVAAMVVCCVACTASQDATSSFVMAVAAGGANLRRDCELAQRRCSRCHSIERVQRANITLPRQWRSYVRRMRLMPGSHVSAADERPITRCFIYRTSGQRGLAELALEEAR